MGEVQVCLECGMKSVRPNDPVPGELLYEIIVDILKAPGFEPLSARKVACLGNCDAECRVALADPDRWSWMLGQIDPKQDEGFLREVIALWLAAPNGLIKKSDRPQKLTDKALGRMPPVLPRNRSL